MQDLHRAALVRALAAVFVDSALTNEDRRLISNVIESDIAQFAASGVTDVEELATLAVKQALKRRRQIQGAASPAGGTIVRS